MQLFYSIDIDHQVIVFKDEELRHLTVLRKNTSDIIHATDGKGNLYTCEIISLSKKEASANIISKETKALGSNSNVHLFISPTKQMDRIEWLFEKLVELGLHEISFIETQHSERNKINIQRLEKIALSAMKQSLRFYLPIIHPIQKFNNCISNNSKNSIKLIAHCEVDKSKIDIKQLALEKDIKYEVYIGPEGDFSTEEIQIAKANQAIPISLGDYRLRTETAGLIATINLLSRI